MAIGRARRGVRTLEKQFVDHLARGWLDRAEAERGFRAFMQFENLIDRGELADRKRRGKLEEAYEEYQARQRAYEFSQRIKQAGQLAGSRQAGVRIEPAKRHSIRPDVTFRPR